MNQNIEYFKSNELALASALIVLGYPLFAIDKQKPKSVFLFERNEGLDELVKDFWTGNLRIEPKLYFNAIKEIKSRLYSED